MTEQTARPDVAAFLGFLNAVPGPKAHELPAVDARRMYSAMRPVADAEPTPLAVIRNLTIPGPAGDIPARLYDARDTRTAGPVMVFYHGGGFVIGDLDTHEPFCTEAAAALDIPVIAIDYRLAPEHPFPAAPDDCEAATRWIAGNPAELGRSVTSLVLCGDSAGGNLTIVTALALRDAPGAVPVIAQLPYYPAVSEHNDWHSTRNFADGHLLTRDAMDWFMDQYQGELDSPRYAPMLADATGLPPTVLVTAGLDPLRDQGRAFAARLIEAGVKTAYYDAVGNVHGLINLRKGVPSSAHDIAHSLGLLKTFIDQAAT